MLSRVMAALATLATVSAVASAAAVAPALAEGMTASAAHPAARSVRHDPRHPVAYRTVRDTWSGGPDPYAYSYRRVGYYPAYNSDQWVPRSQMLGRSNYPLRLPAYYSSWGYPLGCKLHGRRDCGAPLASPANDSPGAMQFDNGSQ